MATSSLLQYFETEADKAATASKAVMDRSDAEGRDITPDEKAEIDAHLEQFRMYKARAASEMTKIEIRERLEQETGVADQVKPVRIEGAKDMPNTLGEAFIQSGAWKAIEDGHRSKSLGRDWKSGAVELPRALISGRKAAASPVLESNGSSLFGTGGLLTSLLAMEEPAFVVIPPSISDLIPSLQVQTGNSVSYPIVKNRTPAAYPGNQPIAEGVTKFNALYEFDITEVKLKKLGVYTKLSTEFLEDAPGVAAYINADLPAQIRAAEDAYFATVLAAAAATSTTLASGTKWDAILGAITDVRAAGGTPDGVVISPINWAEVLTEVPSSGDGHYISGTGPQTGNPFAAWGVRVVISANAPDDLPIVGDFARGAKAYRKGGLTVDSTNTDQNDFILNLMTIRAEERVALGITYPEWFVQANLA